ncbi:AAA family ATPase [Sagittula sp. NFXS13]|uniref:AAA family ATPase n=1 Tax=Sagittula sp. NFXS13 TaxID=2819095 RepID=UPI0032E0489C
MEHRVAINLFGQFEARLDGVPVRMPTRKVELILALLAIEPDVALSRSTLAGMLWPGQPDAQARASLRQAIFRLKTALDSSDTLEVTSGWIKLRSEHIERDIDALGRGAEASALPIGTPLEGMSGFEPEVEDRLEAARAELRASLMNWLEEAEAKALGKRRFADLETLARRHLVLDGYDENALRMLMTALWRQGRRNAALDVFRETSQRIRADLSVSVDPSTIALYREIKAQPAAPKDQKRTAVTAEQVEPATSPARPPAEATLPHLRHVAVMHVVSGRLLAALRNRDPEDAEAASRAASDAIERIVRREGGLILGRAGHRLSCAFGVERPDESPALSAALAAFEVARLDCTVGIDAARALIGGESDNFPAAHLAQVLAEAGSPGEVRITDAVADACRGAFVLKRIDSERAEDEHPAAWFLNGEVLSRGGFDIRRARGLTPFVGRAAEVETIVAVNASNGPRSVVITGDAGIGKSRLVHECLGRLRPRHLLRVQFLPNETGGSLTRFSPVLTSLLPTGTADVPMHLLDSAIQEGPLRRRIAPVEALFAARSATPENVEMPRGVRLQAIADALLLAIQLLAGRDSILLVEDAHWSDDDSAMLLERILRSLDRDGPLVIVTLRPGHGLHLSEIAGLHSMALAPLSETDSLRLLTLLGREDSGGIAGRSGGVPLFLEEIARTSTTPGDELQSIPESLASLLTRRINALPPHLRQTIEAAAVLGAEPADDLLQPLSGLRSDAYEAAIAELADGDLLFRIRSVPQRVYGFKHALVQDAVYNGIPASRRVALHRIIVQHHDNGAVALDAQDLARHAEEGRLRERAIEVSMRAARAAVDRSSYALANRMTELALRAIRASPSSDDLLRLEADILTWRRALLWPLAQRKQMLEGLDRAEVIARMLGDDQRLAEVSIHRAYMHSDDGRPQDGLKFFEQAEAAAERAGNPRLSAESALARCQILSLQGKMKAARAAIAEHIGAWDERRHALDGLIVTRYVMLQFHLARINGALGDGQKAWSHIESGVATALETKRPVDRYIACRAIAEVSSMTGNSDQAIRAFKMTREIAAKAELPAYVAWSEAELAELALATCGSEEGTAKLRSLLDEGDKGLLKIAQIKAQTALACAEDDMETALTEMRNVLKEAEAVDMPLIRIKLMREIASRLKDLDPTQATALNAAADRIVTEEAYRPARLPKQSVGTELIDAFRLNR